MYGKYTISHLLYSPGAEAMLRGLLYVPSPGGVFWSSIWSMRRQGGPTSSGIPSAAVIRNVCTWGVVVGVSVEGDFDIGLCGAGCREGSREKEAKADGGLHDA